jgi:hypothetical protein
VAFVDFEHLPMRNLDGSSDQDYKFD